MPYSGYLRARDSETGQSEYLSDIDIDIDLASVNEVPLPEIRGN